MNRTKLRFTAKRWLRRLERAELTAAEKETGRAFIVACKNKQRWTAAWEVDGAWKDGNTVSADLHRIGQQNLILYKTGLFLPVVGPRVPRAGEYTLTPEQIGLLRDMLLRRGGRCLWYIVRHGYIDRRDAKARWLLKSTSPNAEKWPKTIPYRSSVVRPLVRRRIVESNGCTWGGFEWTAELRVNLHRLYSIANMPASMKRFIRTD